MTKKIPSGKILEETYGPDLAEALGDMNGLFKVGTVDDIMEDIVSIIDEHPVKETNDYGMYSGGYIFDQMDRSALSYVKMKAELPDNAVIVTQAVDGLRYKRQLCDKYNVTVRCFDFHKIELFSILYCCKAEVINNKGEIVAEAQFTFTEATNHCEIVGRQ